MEQGKGEKVEMEPSDAVVEREWTDQHYVFINGVKELINVHCQGLSDGYVLIDSQRADTGEPIASTKLYAPYRGAYKTRADGTLERID